MINLSDIITTLKEKIKGKNVRIVFPEASDARIIKAAQKLGNEGLIKPVLIGDPNEIVDDVSMCEVINPNDSELYNEFVQALVERRAGKCSYGQAQEMLKKNNYFGTMLVYTNNAHGLVSGAAHSTGDTVRPALQIIKTKPGISRTFGYFLMVREDEKYIMGDCAINPNPDSEALAEFAIESAKAATIFGIDPKVALLSFSTNGSAESDETKKVRDAVKIAKKKAPELAIDGEMQFDAAFVPSVGEKKFPDSKVAGHANTFVFPDLNSGNIGYKMAQRLGNFEAMGPVLAGLNKPVNDLSRGCSVEDAYNTAIITAAQSLME